MTEVRFPARQKFLSSPLLPDQLRCPPSHMFSVIEVGVMRPAREADYLPQPSARVKMRESIIPRRHIS
jgi:hypothetical protein